MKQLLINLKACNEAIKWAGDKSWEEIYNTCHRGDWFLWLHQRTNNEDLRVRTLAKGHCVNTVRHLMQDERSLKAVDTAIAFGEGRATRQELDASVTGAIAAANAADNAADNANYDNYPSIYAAFSAASSGATDSAYIAAGAGAFGACAAKIKNQKETADIVRKYIPIEFWNVQKMIDEVKVEKEVNND